MINIIDANLIIPIVLTFIAYIIAYHIYIKTKFPFLTPIVTTAILVGISIKFLGIPYEVYYETAGKFINAFIGPTTVALALPIYKNRKILINNLAVIILSVAIGSTIGIVGIFLISRLIGISTTIMASLLAKSVTTSVAIDLAINMNGIKSITVLAVIISGVSGAIFAKIVCKIFRIKSPIAVGLAIGTSSHAIGTTKALEIGETEGAMSGIAIGVASAITVLILPLLYKALNIIWAL